MAQWVLGITIKKTVRHKMTTCMMHETNRKDKIYYTKCGKTYQHH